MDQLHEAEEAIDKLLAEAHHLERVASDALVHDRVELALSVTKRVRRASTMCVQALARARDSYSRGGTSA